MQTKTKGILKLSVVFALVALIAILGLTGSLRIGKYRFYPFSDFLKPGLDLGGGVVAELAATQETADEAVSILRKRFAHMDMNEASVARQGDGVRVEVPADTGAQDLVSELCATGSVEFVDTNGDTVLESGDIASSRATTAYDSSGNSVPAAEFTVTSEAAQRLGESSDTLLGQSVTVYLDNTSLGTITLDDVLSGGSGLIATTNYATYAEAVEASRLLSAILASGQLPEGTELSGTRNITAAAGESAGTLTAVAVCVALAVGVALLIARYRLAGAGAALNALVWALAVVIVLCETSFARMSLSGVAAIVLGVGAMVCASGLLLETCAFEIQQGHAPAIALRRAYRRALPAWLDGGVVLALAAGLLYWLGAGAVKNFASVLLVCVVSGLIVLLLFSRFFVGAALQISPKAPAPRAGAKAPRLPLRACGAACAIVIVAALVLQLCGVGLRAGSDIGGGSIVRYAMGESFALSDVEAALRSAGIRTAQVLKTDATVEEAADETASADAADTASSDATASADTADTASSDATASADAIDTASSDATASADATDTASSDATASADAADAASSDATASADAADTASSGANDGMTDVEIRVSADESDALTAALPALEAELSAAYPGMRLISDQRVSANGTGGIGSALAFVALACACACVYLAIRYGAPALVAALACCVAGTLTGGGLLCLFGWAFRASLSLTAAAAFVALWSTCAAALALGHMHAIAREPGKTRLSRAQIAQSAAPDIWRRVAAFAAPMLVGGACMLALGPGSVRAMGLALVAATLAGAVCACAFCGALWARLGGKSAK